MIPANELRIGNWVNDRHGKPIKVSLVSTMDKVEADPIPLTPEILEKCGFVLDGVWKLGDFEIGLEGDDFVKQLMTVRYKKSIMVKVGPLHQLQNLYFALTGEELNIQL